MPRKYRLDDLRTRCLRRADRESATSSSTPDPSFSVPEINMLIDEQYGDLYSEVEKTGMRHFEATASIVATGAASYTVPDDHLSTLAVRRIDAAGGRIELEELMVQEETRWASTTGDASCYTLVGTSLVLYPRPSSGNYELLYVPQSPDLATAADTTVVDVVTADGLAFLTWGVAFKILSKSESDVQVALTEREAARARLIDWCALKAFTQPRRPVVRTSINGNWPFESRIDDPGGWWDR